MIITDKTAQLAKTPTGKEDLTDWILEPKYDGWRMMVVIETDDIRWFGRSALEYSGKTPHIDRELHHLPTGTVLDGELIHPGGWRKAQEVLGSEDRICEELQFVAYDVLQIAGEDRRSEPFFQRRAALESLFNHYLNDEKEQLQLAPQSEYTEEAIKKLVVDGWEGGVVKNPHSPYVGGRRSTWLKFKAEWTEDCVVYGGLPAKGELEGQVGSLKIGQYDSEGKLVPLGNSWGKFSREERLELTELWKDGTLDDEVMVVELTIQGFTNKGKFRAPVIQRIRQDKMPSECVLTDKSEIYTL